MQKQVQMDCGKIEGFATFLAKILPRSQQKFCHFPGAMRYLTTTSFARFTFFDHHRQHWNGGVRLGTSQRG